MANMKSVQTSSSILNALSPSPSAPVCRESVEIELIIFLKNDHHWWDLGDCNYFSAFWPSWQTYSVCRTSGFDHCSLLTSPLLLDLCTWLNVHMVNWLWTLHIWLKHKGFRDHPLSPRCEICSISWILDGWSMKNEPPVFLYLQCFDVFTEENFAATGLNVKGKKKSLIQTCFKSVMLM